MVALFWIDWLIHLTYQPPVNKVFDIVRDFGGTNWQPSETSQLSTDQYDK